MTALERLNRVRSRWTEYHRLVMKVEELETLATKMVPLLAPNSDIHGSSKSREDTWALLADYRNECKDKLYDYLKDSRELEQELSCIRSPRIRTAMKYRYIDCMTKRQMAEAMNYSERQLTRFLKSGETIYCNAYREVEEDGNSSDIK